MSYRLSAHFAREGDDGKDMSWLQRTMYGRNGTDQLSVALFALYGVLCLLSTFTGLGALQAVAVVPIALSIFRVLSRNIPKRRAENAKFMSMIDPIFRWIRLRHAIHTDKEHRYFKCPNCGQRLRVPRGKGRIQITCRSCGVSFEENT